MLTIPDSSRNSTSGSKLFENYDEQEQYASGQQLTTTAADGHEELVRLSDKSPSKADHNVIHQSVQEPLAVPPSRIYNEDIYSVHDMRRDREGFEFRCQLDCWLRSPNNLPLKLLHLKEMSLWARARLERKHERERQRQKPLSTLRPRHEKE